MIIRIVKMTFRPEAVPEFRENFEANKRSIRTFSGCKGLYLLQDIHEPNVIFTYSYWKSEDHLNAYRQSELFGTVWKQTKALFAAKPEAWSVNRVVELP